MKKTKRKLRNRGDIDSIYFFKLVVVLILGSIWLKISNNQSWQLPLPIGMVPGILVIRKERARGDRKIMYSVLLVAMLVGFWTPIGLYLTI